MTTRGRKPADLLKAIDRVDQAHISCHRQERNMRMAHQLLDAILVDGKVDNRDKPAVLMLHRLVIHEQSENLGTDVRLEEACVCLSDL